VLHSFTHLAEASASPQFAEAFSAKRGNALTQYGLPGDPHAIRLGCANGIYRVYGESLAKVFRGFVNHCPSNIAQSILLIGLVRRRGKALIHSWFGYASSCLKLLRTYV